MKHTGWCQNDFENVQGCAGPMPSVCWQYTARIWNVLSAMPGHGPHCHSTLSFYTVIDYF